ncbi:MAG: hypothetical protein EHM55_08895 [Acidobacteria bacterium]|nr:MAG: hypothetical protein EHM55_08895 [Acidobacteriota bacterium]
MIEYDSKPFGHGPVHHLDRLLAFQRIERAGVWRCAAAAFLISWPPLVVAAAWEGLAVGGASHESLIFDFVAIARYAIAVPLLVFGESIYVPRLCRIHREFAEGGFVADEDQKRFAELGTRTEHVLGSVWMEVALVVLAYGITFGVQDAQYRTGSSSWATPVIDGLQYRSSAGWWRMLVSHPLFLLLVLRNVVRLCTWTSVLWRISRMNLRLVAVHADRVGGLRFVTTSVYALLPLAFTFGVLMAAPATEGVVVDGMSPWDFQNRIIATPIIALAAFAGPLLVFEQQLWRLKVQGVFDYGNLATRVGRRFEARWLTRSPVTESVLDAPDFSATTDLFSIVANVRESRLVLVDSLVMVPLIVTVLAPFVPLFLALVRVDEILKFVWRAVM